MKIRRGLLVATSIAAAVLVAAACSGKKSSGKTTFVVTDYYTHAGVPGVSVVLADAAGNAITTVVTDSSGVAALHVGGNQSATVYFTDGHGYYESDSYFDLTDGDVVNFPVVISSQPAQNNASYSLTWHGAPAGTTHYSVLFDCQADGIVGTSEATVVACGADSPSNVFVFALDATNHRIGWGAAPDLPATGGVGTATADLDVGNTSFAPLSVGHGPLGSFTPTFAGAQAPIYVDTAGAFMTTFPFATLSTSTGPVSGAAGRVPMIPGAIVVPQVIFQDVLSTAAQQFMSASQGFSATSTPASFAPDFSAVVVPGIPTADFTDPLAPSVSWTNGAGTDAGTWGSAGVSFNDTIIRFAYFPTGTTAPTTAKLPHVPSALSAWDGSGPGYSFVEFHASSQWPSYRSYLANSQLAKTSSYRVSSAVRTF